MKLDRFMEEDEDLRINLDPMIDCIFQLVLFFLVTASFIKLEQDLTIDLPSHNRQFKSVTPPRPTIVNVRLRPDGSAEYNVGNERMSVATLAVNLSRAKVQNKDQAVVIRGDKRVRWEHVAAVLKTCSDVGISKVSTAFELLETR